MGMELFVQPNGTIGVRNGGMPQGLGLPAFRATGSPDVGSLYAEGGLFGTCKQHPVLFNAIVGPMGFEGVLHWYGTRNENPVYQSLVYVGTTTTDQAGVCADCGKPIELRCAQSACFGRLCQQTNEVVFDDVGVRANENVPTLLMFGNITDAAGNVLIANGQPIDDIFIKNLAEAAYNLRLDNSTVLWDGNPSANTAGRWEYPGFNMLVNTGKTDVATGEDCPLLDSWLLNYGNLQVGALNSPSILAYVSRLIRQLRFRASGAGLDPETMTTYIVMPYNLWHCVAEAAACEYGLVCSQNVAAQTRNDAMALARTRDAYISGMYLTIDGKNYPVVLDTQIPQTFTSIGNTNVVCADIYAITTHINDKEITYGEFQDFDQTAKASLAWFRKTFGADIISVTDGGRFAVAPTTFGGFCYDARILTKPRVMMLMPWLSGRVQNVCCHVLGGAFPDVTGSGGIYDERDGAQWWPPNYFYGPCFDAGQMPSAPR